MSAAPDRCLYCQDGDEGCGFCDGGRPLDTQEDWDASWGDRLTRLRETLTGKDNPRLRAACRTGGSRRD